MSTPSPSPTTQTQVVSISLESALDCAARQLQSGLLSVTELDSSVKEKVSKFNASTCGYEETYTAELDRLTASLSASAHTIESKARALLLRADALAKSISPSIDVSVDLRAQAKALTTELLRLHKQTDVDAQELRRIAVLADRRLRTGRDFEEMTERRFESSPWEVDQIGGSIVVLLSDVYSAIRELETKSEGRQEDKEWVAPTSFERVTTKYWVSDEHLYEVLLSSVQDLPLLVYGKKGGRILNQKEVRSTDSSLANGALWTSFVTSISSVYFDSNDMSMYSERLKRSEGAQLFRIRWYGSKPRGEKNVFLELKTHHEKWIGDKSVKERCAIQEKDVSQLLDFKSGVWDEARAYAMVQKANPSEDEKSMQKLAILLLKMRATIVKFKLTACVRTKYTRVALQSSSSNACRLTFDRDLMVINERGAAPSSSNSWCLEDHDTLSQHDIVKIPYNVYEVKIAGEDGKPNFVTELEDSRAIVEAKKFSKFLSGASLFNAGKVETLPWWSDEEAFAPLYNGPSYPATATAQDLVITPSLIQCSIDENASTLSGSSRYSIERPLVQHSRDYLQRQLNGSYTSVDDSDTLDSSVKRSIMNQSLPTTTMTTTSVSNTGQSGKKRRGNLVSMRRRSASMILKEDRISSKSKPIASKQRLRVEPKSHFANERTFIQWISAALLFITFSQLLYILGSSNPAIQGQTAIAGTWMIAMSLFIAVYALVIYYRRVYLMQNGKPYGYADFFGPGLLTFAVISGVALILAFSGEFRFGTTSTLIPVSGQCMKRSLSGVPVMELQPSGELVDEKEGLLLVPSLNHIVAFEAALPLEGKNDQQAHIVATVPGANMEALEQVGNYIYALSEGTDKKSEIIALEWIDSSLDGVFGGATSRRLQESHRWKISLQGVEGMALVPEGQLGEGSAAKLLVAGLLMEPTTKGLVEVLSIDAFDQDSFDFTQTKLDNTSKVNKKVVAKGLKDEKVGSMQFFEGRLYVLFDNERVVRVFDPKTGLIVQELMLPIAEAGAEHEWEGMRLQRINNGTSSGLRGAIESRVVLHLALDSPAQIWSLSLQQEEGRWIMPQCAGV
mmetsp:Transcript_19641/g.32197  ORF Transcript_19641/g.32197 Transcript_19641/m.32197 type:complete len:1073 (-) Transcript_19641:9-3227(-)